MITAPRARLVVLGVAALGFALAACQPAKKAPPAPPLAPPPPELSAPPPGSPTLVQEPVVGGLNTPWDIAFVPGTNTMLFTEKRGGDLTRWDVETDENEVIHHEQVHDVSATGTEGVEPAHAGHIESGLLGVAVHPQFNAGKPWVYLSLTTEFDVQVRRYTLDMTTSPWHLDELNRLTGIPFGEIHNGGRIRFQPGTTNLFVTTGDSTSSITSQFLGSAGGKVLRVNENLVAASGNPFINVPNADTRVYTFGHRNVQGLAFARGACPTRPTTVRTSTTRSTGWSPVGTAAGTRSTRTTTASTTSSYR